MSWQQAKSTAERIYTGVREKHATYRGSGDPENWGASEPQCFQNDARLLATAESIDADLVGADRDALEGLGPRFLRFR